MGSTNEQKQQNPSKKLIKDEPKKLKKGQQFLTENN